MLACIKSAKKSVEIAIFRFDRRDVEMALKAAAAEKRVGVTSVIAFANRGGEHNLRSLELCFAAVASSEAHAPVVPGAVRKLPGS